MQQENENTAHAVGMSGSDKVTDTAEATDTTKTADATKETSASGKAGSDKAAQTTTTAKAPKIAPTARIARNATVIGDVELGQDCTVLFGAVLRGDMGRKIVVGDRTNIQEGVCVHVPTDGDTIIGSDVTVGHGAIVHGCTIGNGTLVGMGAIMLDGAKVGKRCLIAAGALVTGTADIPDEMLVIGSPAKAVRPLTEAEIESLAESAEEYVQIGRDLAEQDLIDEGFAANLGCMSAT